MKEFKSLFNSSLSAFKKNALETIFPEVCSFCAGNIQEKIPLEGICRKCLAQIPVRSKNQRRISCLDKKNHLFKKNDLISDKIIYVPCLYQGNIKKALLEMKFYDAQYYGHFFGSLLVYFFENEIKTHDLILPVPLGKERYAKRGFNQAGIIAKKIADLTGVKYNDEILLRTKNTLRQTELKGYNERIMNMENAFCCSNSETLKNKKILLVDDVITSGTTIYAAMAEIKKKSQVNMELSSAIVIASGRADISD